ncbi:hypothetical protein PI124_g20449 [Phytophthora idaei]|nr:hypothetical protein PI125_g23311 [Phytophthora idaei]KAG3128561.1 hypothetical protein PI126_g21348 [Phytophthora idaei]KAG3234497.1 hypothetical protein PI124_g20449 [Phytophthora idaei]
MGCCHFPIYRADAREIREIVDAALEGNLAIVQRLVSEAVAIDKEEALRLTATGGHLAVVQYLIECDVDVNAARIDGDTALMMAALNGFLQVTRYLANQCNADVNAKRKQSACEGCL